MTVTKTIRSNVTAVNAGDGSNDTFLESGLTPGKRWAKEETFALGGTLEASSSPYYPPGAGRILGACMVNITNPTSVNPVNVRFLIRTVQDNRDGTQSATVAHLDVVVPHGKLKFYHVFPAPPLVFSATMDIAASLTSTPGDGLDLTVVAYFL